MRLTTRSRFALIAMTDVALRGVHGPVTLSSVHERHGISLSYLEILFSALRRAGLVVSTRGPGGGYSLARKSCDITAADVAMASEQWKAGPAEQDRGTMSADQGAMTHTLWLTFNQAVLEHLRGVSLADLVCQHREVHNMRGEIASPEPRPKKRTARTGRRFALDGVPNSVFALGNGGRTR